MRGLKEVPFPSQYPPISSQCTMALCNYVQISWWVEKSPKTTKITISHYIWLLTITDNVFISYGYSLELNKRVGGSLRIYMCPCSLFFCLVYRNQPPQNIISRKIKINKLEIAMQKTETQIGKWILGSGGDGN